MEKALVCSIFWVILFAALAGCISSEDKQSSSESFNLSDNIAEKSIPVKVSQNSSISSPDAVETDKSRSTEPKRLIKLEIDRESNFFNEENKQMVYSAITYALISNGFEVLPKDCPMNASIDKLSVLYEETKGKEYSIPTDLTSFVVKGTKIKCTLSLKTNDGAFSKTIHASTPPRINIIGNSYAAISQEMYDAAWWDFIDKLDKVIKAGIGK